LLKLICHKSWVKHRWYCRNKWIYLYPKYLNTCIKNGSTLRKNAFWIYKSSTGIQLSSSASRKIRNKFTNQIKS
jgi:hypothetical protein